MKLKASLNCIKTGEASIALAKATYEGLKEAKPPEYYQWFPEWMNKDQLF